MSHEDRVKLLLLVQSRYVLAWSSYEVLGVDQSS